MRARVTLTAQHSLLAKVMSDRRHCLREYIVSNHKHRAYIKSLQMERHLCQREGS